VSIVLRDLAVALALLLAMLAAVFVAVLWHEILTAW
jgi:hypothetical protein